MSDPSDSSSHQPTPNPATTKISKACEPCRRRKIRCSGTDPCAHCAPRPAECIYRAKPRVRLTAAERRARAAAESHVSPSSATISTTLPIQTSTSTAAAKEDQVPAQPELYHSVAATHDSPKVTDSSQLFYGPSSNFAFLQQIHRGIILSGGSRKRKRSSHHASEPKKDGVLEVGAGLDMFMQRSIFFGTPLRTDPELADQTIPREMAELFLEKFKLVSSLPLAPPELDHLLPTLYPNTSPSRPSPLRAPHPQRTASFLAALAIGAQSTPHTTVAEALFLRARREAIPYEDAVTLPMVQFSVLMAEYQLNMGRPNSAWLHIGVACRKALALGLHAATADALVARQPETENERRMTMWSLYFVDIWLSVTLGRKSMLRKEDISCPFPDRSVLQTLCKLTAILEEAADTMYSRRTESLRQLYATADGIYTKLRECGDKFGIGSAIHLESQNIAPPAILMVHNVYYHSILLTFRPFLVAESALESSRNSASHTSEMWLRQACRHAIDAAQDTIVFIKNMYGNNDICKTKRYNAFFLEASCGVLLHDSLRHPPKHPHHMEFIDMALECLGSMVDDVPVINAAGSVRSMLGAVQKAITTKNTSHAPAHSSSAAAAPATAPAATTPSALPSATLLETPATTTHTPSSDGSSPWNPSMHPNIQFPSLADRNAQVGGGSMAAAEDLIYFSDRCRQDPPRPEDLSMEQMQQGGDAGMNMFSGLDFDVMTTDLFNFFPIDMSMLPRD